MKVRIKFSKEGAMRFIGHLDTMRYFQKAIRRSGIPAAYSEGFSPHMLLSFAAPLGVGMAGKGEYFDLQIKADMPPAQITDCLEKQMAEGFHVLSTVRVEEGKAGKAMSLVAAADYTVRFREGREYVPDWEDGFMQFMSLSSIPVVKRTKRGEKTVDIRPLIYEFQIADKTILMRLASASSDYIKPELVMDSFAVWLGVAPEPFSYIIQREEVYADLGDGTKHQFVTLESLGEK